MSNVNLFTWPLLSDLNINWGLSIFLIVFGEKPRIILLQAISKEDLEENWLLIPSEIAFAYFLWQGT